MSERRNNGIAVPLPLWQPGFSGRTLICAEYGLHFAREADLWRCVERPELVMLRGERYRVGERTFGSLDEALRRLEVRGFAQDQ